MNRIKILSVVMLWALVSQVAFSQDILIRDGAACDILKGFNAADYHKSFNHKGMGEFCVFPHKAIEEAFINVFENLRENGLVHPICITGLVVGPVVSVYPCYKLINGIEDLI